MYVVHNVLENRAQRVLTSITERRWNHLWNIVQTASLIFSLGSRTVQPCFKELCIYRKDITQTLGLYMISKLFKKRPLLSSVYCTVYIVWTFSTCNILHVYMTHLSDLTPLLWSLLRSILTESVLLLCFHHGINWFSSQRSSCFWTATLEIPLASQKLVHFN